MLYGYWSETYHTAIKKLSKENNNNRNTEGSQPFQIVGAHWWPHRK